MNTLFPLSAPYRTHTLSVSGGHRLFVAEHGRADGIPVLVLHGGPGSGCSPRLASLFDPDRYRIILPDQRGARHSQPAGGRIANTTADLLDDIEQLRLDLGIARWFVCGGSWGATLGLLYAASRPEAVCSLLLRNPFLARIEDLNWFFGGARIRHPVAWQAWAALGAPEANGAMLPWLIAMFESRTDAELVPWVRAWALWEAALAGTPARSLSDDDVLNLRQRYRLQLHYFRQGCFLSAGGVLPAAATLAGHALPVAIVQGLGDDVCPPSATRCLLDVLPGARIHWVSDVGHDPFAPAMVAATQQAWAELNSGEVAD